MITTESQTRAEMSHAQDVAADYVPMAARHTPTPKQISVRNELEEIGKFDSYDATRMVMGYLDVINQRVAAGVSAEQIAIDMTLVKIVGLSFQEAEFVQTRAKNNGVPIREAAKNFPLSYGLWPSS